MIDWYYVGFCALWIVGLGFLLTALSFAQYMANRHKRCFWKELKKPPYRIVVDIGLVFFSLGWTGVVAGILERVAWAILTLIFLSQTLQHKRITNS